MEPLRIMTFNIRQGRALDGANRWYRRRDLVFDVIKARIPHVLGAQEVNPNQLDELLRELEGFGAIVHRRYGGIFGAHAPILFDGRRLEAAQSGDFWLAPDPDGDKVRGWDAAVPRLCTWAVFRERDSDARFVVFNTHFDHRGRVAQIESARLMVERLSRFEHLPRLVTADLNANESSDAVAVFLEAGFRDSFRVVSPDEAPAFTYHRFRGRLSRGVLGKIDYVLSDARWGVVGAEIVRTEYAGRLPSDHYPVVADLTLRA